MDTSSSNWGGNCLRRLWHQVCCRSRRWRNRQLGMQKCIWWWILSVQASRQTIVLSTSSHCTSTVKNQSTKKCKQQAIATTLGRTASKQLHIEVTRCPSDRHWVTSSIAEKPLTSIASRLTLPKLHLATANLIYINSFFVFHACIVSLPMLKMLLQSYGEEFKPISSASTNSCARFLRRVKMENLVKPRCAEWK